MYTSYIKEKDMIDMLIKEPFLGFSRESLDFLKLLENKRYNNKMWFDKNRSTYENFIKLPMRALIDNLAIEINKIDTSIVVNYKSIFRINRDIRFTKDKTPYKTMTSASFCFGTIKKPEIPQFYYHLSPAEFLFAGGQYSSDPDKLKKIRRKIYSESDTFKKIIFRSEFKKEYKKICGVKAANLPRGYENIKYEKDGELLAELIKMKQYYVYKSYRPEVAFKPEVVNLIINNIKLSYNFTKFLNDALF